MAQLRHRLGRLFASCSWFSTQLKDAKTLKSLQAVTFTPRGSAVRIRRRLPRNQALSVAAQINRIRFGSVIIPQTPWIGSLDGAFRTQFRALSTTFRGGRRLPTDRF